MYFLLNFLKGFLCKIPPSTRRSGCGTALNVVHIQAECIFKFFLTSCIFIKISRATYPVNFTHYCDMEKFFKVLVFMRNISISIHEYTMASLQCSTCSTCCPLEEARSRKMNEEYIKFAKVLPPQEIPGDGRRPHEYTFC